jgi:hypothetical protein
LQERLDPSETHFGGGDICNPFYFADQDIFNAMLCTQYDGRVIRVEHRLAPFPPFTGLTITDVNRLECRYPDGASPYLLHHILKKPWLAPLKESPYSQLFTRVVASPDVRVPLRAREVPLRLRNSRLAPVDRWRVSIQLEAHRRFRGKLGIRPVLERQVRKVVRRGAA